MKKLLNKYVFLSLLAACITLTSCSDEEDYSAGPQTDANCPALTFGVNNSATEELDPTEATQVDITVYRQNGSADASYPIKVISNTGNIFSVPASVNFASGASEATITVSFDNAEIGKPYTLEIGLDDTNVDPYNANTYTSYVYTCTRVKWNTLGTGQFLDGFWYWFWDEITIQQREDMPNVYRITNPYTDDWVNYFGEATATYEEYIMLTLSSTDYVSWETFSMNTNYDGEIMAYYPSSYASGSADDANSYAVRDDDGKLLYFVIDPYWVNDTGYWAYYPCYIAFPGVDLAGEWGW